MKSDKQLFTIGDYFSKNDLSINTTSRLIRAFLAMYLLALPVLLDIAHPYWTVWLFAFWLLFTAIAGGCRSPAWLVIKIDR